MGVLGGHSMASSRPDKRPSLQTLREANSLRSRLFHQFPWGFSRRLSRAGWVRHRAGLVLPFPGGGAWCQEGHLSLNSSQRIRLSPPLAIAQVPTRLLEWLSSKQAHKCALQKIPETLPVGWPTLGRDQPCQRDPCRGLGPTQGVVWWLGNPSKSLHAQPRSRAAPTCLPLGLCRRLYNWNATQHLQTILSHSV